MQFMRRSRKQFFRRVPSDTSTPPRRRVPNARRHLGPWLWWGPPQRRRTGKETTAYAPITTFFVVLAYGKEITLTASSDTTADLDLQAEGVLRIGLTFDTTTNVSLEWPATLDVAMHIAS